MSSPWTQSLSIRTPEGVVFSLPLAGPTTRFLAWAIDTGAVLAAQGILSSLLIFFRIFGGGISAAMMILAFFVLTFGYNILLEWLWNGKTLGKHLLGIRVMDIQGLRLRASQIVLRNLIRAADAMPALYLAGGVAMLLSRRAQRLGDLAANTVVVRTGRALQPDLEKIMPDKYNSFRAYPHLEARLRQRVSPGETALLMQALLRRDELDAPARVALYAEFAGHFRKLAPFPEEAAANLSDEQYLRNALESIFRPSKKRRTTAAEQ